MHCIILLTLIVATLGQVVFAGNFAEIGSYGVGKSNEKNYFVSNNWYFVSIKIKLL